MEKHLKYLRKHLFLANVNYCNQLAVITKRENIPLIIYFSCLNQTFFFGFFK